jgi:hypothetical protein
LIDAITKAPIARLHTHNQIASLKNSYPRQLPSPDSKMTRQSARVRPKKKRVFRRKAVDDSAIIAVRLEALSLPDTGDQDQLHGTPETASHGQPQPATRTKKTRGFKTVKIHKGFRYTKSWSSSKNITYRCSTYRTSGCKAVLKVTPTAEWRVEGAHTCRRNVVASGSLANVTNAMKRETD